MPDPAVLQLVKQLADLRLQVNALEIVAKDGSISEMLRQTRRTIFWSAALVFIALLGSSGVRLWQVARTHAIEQRIEQLEHDRKTP